MVSKISVLALACTGGDQIVFMAAEIIEQVRNRCNHAVLVHLGDL